MGPFIDSDHPQLRDGLPPVKLESQEKSFVRLSATIENCSAEKLAQLKKEEDEDARIFETTSSVLSYAEFTATLLAQVMLRVISECPHTRVIVMPSVRDLCSRSCLPQPSFLADLNNEHFKFHLSSYLDSGKVRPTYPKY